MGHSASVMTTNLRKSTQREAQWLACYGQKYMRRIGGEKASGALDYGTSGDFCRERAFGRSGEGPPATEVIVQGRVALYPATEVAYVCHGDRLDDEGHPHRGAGARRVSGPHLQGKKARTGRTSANLTGSRI